MNNLLAAALQHADVMRPVFPCDPESKAPLIGGGFKAASTDRETIQRWWTKWPRAMIGMPTGERSGVWVLDVDDPAEFEAHCPIKLPTTRRAETGKGYHLYWKWTGGICNRVRVLPGADTRGEGGYVILPPSRHPSGRLYRWSCLDAPIAAPVELLRIVQAPNKAHRECRPAARITEQGQDSRYGLAALERECEAIRNAPHGSQENTLTWAAYRMGVLVAAGKLSSSTAKDRLISAGLAMPSYNSRDPWNADQVRAKICDRLRAGMGEFR